MTIERQLVEASSDGMIAFDREFRYTLWNPAMEQMSGIAAPRVLGRVAFDIFTYLRDNGEQASYAAALRGERTASSRCSFVFGGKRGTYDARYGPHVGHDGAIRGGLAVLRETTTSRAAQARLEETEGRFKTMADAAPVLLWMSGTDSLCTFFNQTWLDFTGRTLAEEWGVGWTEGVHFEDFQHCVDTYEAAFADRRSFEMEYRLRRKDGVYRWILDRGTPRFAPDGTFAGFIGSCIDITERRQLEGSLREAIATRDDFLSIASHELRTPLTSVRLQAESMNALLSTGKAPSEERARRAWSTVQKQLDRLEQLVTNLLDVSRMGTRGPALELEEVDLVEIVRDVADRFRDSLESARCDLTLDAKGEVRGIWDRSRLEQVVTNLVTNAIKYGAEKPIEVRVGEEDAVALVEVRDHGIGIAPEDQQRIFGRFERAVSGSSYGGLGLGLWITRQIVEALNGRIAVESSPSYGATFRVELPRKSCRA